MTISSRTRHYALAILTITYVFNFLDRQLLAILLEPIKNEFGASDTAMGFLYGLAFSLFYATLAIPVARLADKGNRRNILAIAAGLWSVMTVICGFVTSFWQMLGARIGVAVGEAGGVPPSQSMVNDFYPPEQRARAMAVFSSATFIGTLVAMIGGALIAEKLGWRAAFIIVGAPGILLALIIRFTVPEPPRGAYDDTGSSDNASTSVAEVFSTMWHNTSLRALLYGCALASMAGYGLGYWVPAFMIRVHGLSLVEAGLTIGGLGATAALIGTLTGGWLCDRMATKSRNWLLFVPAWGLALSAPFLLLFLFFPVSSQFMVFGHPVPTAVLVYCVAGFVGSWWAAPTYVAVQELVKPNQRTLACAALLFIMNLIGFGLGPLLVGFFSDLLQPTYGNESVRYALMIIMSTYFVAIYYYYKAGRNFTQNKPA